MDEAKTRNDRRRCGRLLLFGAAAALVALTAPDGAEARCQPASYCEKAGNCLSLAQIESKAEARFGGDGYRVARVRLRGHAPNDICLWFEVLLSHPKRGQRVVYFDVRGREAR